jgi:hypothetical protein
VDEERSDAVAVLEEWHVSVEVAPALPDEVAAAVVELIDGLLADWARRLEHAAPVALAVRVSR